MGSVSEYVDCKRCGFRGSAFVDYNWRTGEEYQLCKLCGLGHTYKLKRDEKGNVIRDEEGKLTYDFSETKGNGTAFIMFDNGVGSIHVAPENIEEYDNWFKEIVKEIESNPKVFEEDCYVTKWDEEKKELAVVYGELPLYYTYSSKDKNEDVDGEIAEEECNSEDDMPF